ncbi:MAG: branched-chain amino acid ABC transporter substrate-binding protein [Variovorax sp.]
MKTLLSRLLATCALGLAAVAAVPALAQGKPPIKLVHTAPLSGQLGSVGKLQAIAVDLAVQDVNQSGGINGSQIEVVRFDDQLRPDQAVLRVREAQQSGALAVLGPMSSTQWETAVPTINQLKIPAVNMNSNKPGIGGRPYGTRLNTPDDIGLPEGFAEFVKIYPKAKRVAIMGDVREAAGKAAIDEWTRLARAKGLDIVGTVEFTSGQTDFSPVAIKLKELNPDIVLGSMLSGDAVKLARELQIQRMTAPILCNALIYPGVFPQTVSKSVGEQASQWHTVGQSTNDFATGDLQKYKAFVARYVAAISKDSALNQFQPPNVANASLGYDAVLLVAEAARKAGIDGNTSIDAARDKLRDAINGYTEFRGVNDIKFSADGDGSEKVGVLAVDPATSSWKFVTAK